MSYETELVSLFARQAVEEGFVAYIAEKGTYGIFSDKEGSRVIYFQYSMGEGVTCSSCVTPSGTRWGTGCRLLEVSPKKAWNEGLPSWYRSYLDNNVRHITLEEYLKKNTHSNYQLFQLEIKE